MRFLRITSLAAILALLMGCSSSGPAPASSEVAPAPREIAQLPRTYLSDSHHAKAAQAILFDPVENKIELLPERSASTHLDLAYFWKYYPGMLKLEMIDHDPQSHLLTVAITFTNPLKEPLGDIRAIWPVNGDLLPVTTDGWTIRDGAPLNNPDPYFGFGNDAPLRRLGPGQSDTREIIFRYDPPLTKKSVTFVLDATVNSNTAEPYAFGQPELTGRFFHIQISDWQNDITGAWLDIIQTGYPSKLRLAPFGKDGEWGTSIPDIKSGGYRLLLTAQSPESPGEDIEGEPVTAVDWVDLHWPPVGPLVPLPRGEGFYGYGFTDPDTNLPPANWVQFMGKFRGDMGGKWLSIEYGEVCNSGYLAMHAWTPMWVNWMHSAAPDLPIHITIDNVGFQFIEDDPCHHPVEDYTQLFFDHLLVSVRGQILENPDFDCLSGLHFDLEPFPQSYSSEELRAIYRRYADFLAKLHLEPNLRGRNITLWEWESPGYKTQAILTYLATTDAFMPACYYTEFNWGWDPKKIPTPFDNLRAKLATFSTWARYYGRPYYPALENCGGWFDADMDTLDKITICGKTAEQRIDDYCFGKSAFNTSNEFDVVKDQSVHGMVVEKVVLNLPTGEPIFPGNGCAEYQLGDGIPSTVSDDIVSCRTAYAISREFQITLSNRNPMMPGFIIFRYETNHAWKAAAFAHPIPRGAIAGCSGRIHFADHLSIQQHPELWGKITLELLDPLTPDIVNNVIYRKSIDIVGVEDGSYIFPDLPPAVVTIRAVAPGWESEPATVDLRGQFAYKDNIDLLLAPK